MYIHIQTEDGNLLTKDMWYGAVTCMYVVHQYHGITMTGSEPPKLMEIA